MILNSWQARLLFGLAIWVAAIIHHDAVADCPNTPEWMFLYHFSAALVDGFLLWCAARFVKGRLCDDMESLCLASMCINCLGFFAYVAWLPPHLYNWMILGCGYVQYARLLWAGHYDADRLGRGFLWRHHLGRS